MHSFFWTIEYILTALAFLSTECSLYCKKKQKDTNATNMWCILSNKNNEGPYVLKQRNALIK